MNNKMGKKTIVLLFVLIILLGLLYIGLSSAEPYNPANFKYGTQTDYFEDKLDKMAEDIFGNMTSFTFDGTTYNYTYKRYSKD